MRKKRRKKCEVIIMHFFHTEKSGKRTKIGISYKSSAPETVRCKAPRAQKLCKSHDKNHRESKKYFPCKKTKWN
jgi:hypothetical protein